MKSISRSWVQQLAMFFLVVLATNASGALTVGEWKPVFKGIELSVSTNIPAIGGDILRLQVVHALRVDLSDPDLQFFTTPQNTNYIAGEREVAGYTPSDFLARNDLQVVINAGFFSPGTYYSAPGTPMNIHGLAVSEGTVVSVTDSPEYAPTITFDAQNYPTLILSNWPPASTEGVYTAVSGNYPVLVAGTVVGPRFDVDPRTAFGLSEDRRYLILAAIDGRQPGYSDGATLYESGQWLKALGAHDGINMDGGGSTTLVFEDTTGQPVRINRSSAVADSGRERTVGGHFGIRAKPLPGFFNDLLVEPGITNAMISFTSIEPTTSDILYGLTTNLESSLGATLIQETVHRREITGLTPETGYYFRISGLSSGLEQVSSLYYFQTTNLTETNVVFDLTNTWKYAYTPLDGVQWTSEGFDDSGWDSGPALLWVDTRLNPTPDVEPRNTLMPWNGSYPYVTYYFRTQFTMEELNTGGALLFQSFIDDGAVFYLNGVEIHRMRMPIDFTAMTVATGYPCAGNANCPDEFKIPYATMPSLRTGTNILAVEVHNYNERSNDITFGMALQRIDPQESANLPVMNVTLDGNSIRITWEGGATVESADNPKGPWTELGTFQNALTVQLGTGEQFYRLKR